MGVPERIDRRLFEFLTLEGARLGLSWETVLTRRERYRAVFDGFDASPIAIYDARKLARLLADPGIIRNRLKVAAAVQSARAFLAEQEECGSSAGYISGLVGGRPRRNAGRAAEEVPARIPESEAMSRDLRRRRFALVGPTICVALIQATGTVNDHTVDCFRYRGIRRVFLPMRARAAILRPWNL